MKGPYPLVTSGFLAIAAIVLVASASGGPGWNEVAGHATLAVAHERLTPAPLYGALAAVFAALLPVGEVGFRLSVLSALLGALTLWGVARCGAELLPKHALAGAVALLLLVLSTPFRVAAAHAGPSMLAACGVVWTCAALLALGRSRSHRDAAIAFAAIAVVVGSAPWLGMALAVLAAWVAVRATIRARMIAVAMIAIGATSAAWWIGARGELGSPVFDLDAVLVAMGGGATAVILGAGLLGTAFGAATALPGAGLLGVLVAVVLAHATLVDPSPATACALLAVGSTVIPAAVRQAFPTTRADLAFAVGAAPLIAVTLVAGPTLTIEDPADEPARLADAVTAELPPGPGTFVARSRTVWASVRYAQAVTGARPDLSLAPLAPTQIADAQVADALRARHVVGSDLPAFGRLDPTRALPRGRGFELRAQPSPLVRVSPPPLDLRSTVGAEQAIVLALARARYEAGAGRLDAAARAAGLTDRFRAADLAILATLIPSSDRPALYGFLPPLDRRRPGRWMLDIFGDDLAWVAGLPLPLAASLPPSAPLERRLHALWRDILTGARSPGDLEIAALGGAAVAATLDMLTTTRLNREPVNR